MFIDPCILVVLRPKMKHVCFLEPDPNKFLLKKSLKLFFALTTPNQHKTCINHTHTSFEVKLFFS